MLLLTVDRARALCRDALAQADLAEADARICTDAIMFATERGLDSHGIVSILPGICNSIAVGRIDVHAQIETVGPLVLKGNGVAGPVIGERTMRLAMANARRTGIGAAVALGARQSSAGEVGR